LFSSQSNGFRAAERQQPCPGATKCIRRN